MQMIPTYRPAYLLQFDVFVLYYRFSVCPGLQLAAEETDLEESMHVQDVKASTDGENVQISECFCFFTDHHKAVFITNASFVFRTIHFHTV